MATLAELVAELRRLDAEATPGEWEPDFHSYRDGCELRERRMVIYPAEEGLGSNWPLSTDHGKRADANYTLIAAMRNNLGQLLDAAARTELCERNHDFGCADCMRVLERDMGATCGHCISANEGLLREQNERLRALLGECMPYVRRLTDSFDADSEATAIALLGRIEAALRPQTGSPHPKPGNEREDEQSEPEQLVGPRDGSND